MAEVNVVLHLYCGKVMRLGAACAAHLDFVAAADEGFFCLGDRPASCHCRMAANSAKA